MAGTDVTWTAAEVAAAVAGTLYGTDAVQIVSVGTDSRDVRPGSLFVAIRGDRFDGHDFAAPALAGGASAVMVERSAAVSVTPRIEVDDTLVALRDLAAARRAGLSIPVVAITGSTGKTSTKDMLASALPGACASRRSFNNEIGVPLTVLSTAPECRYLVAEVGSRGVKHIEWLAPAIRPNVAVVTNLGVVHMETFGTPQSLAAAKYELVESLEPNGVAVLPAGEERLPAPHGHRVITFGEAEGADVHVGRVEIDELGRPLFRLSTPVGDATVRLQMAGAHQARNAAAAAAAGIALEVDLPTLVSGLEAAQASPWRMEIHTGRFTVVNDAYNANPDSMASALRTVAAMPGNHLAVVGLMAELGELTAPEHVRIGQLAAALGFDPVVVVGDDPGIREGAGACGLAAADTDRAFEAVMQRVGAGDVVLVKASRAVGLEELAGRLIEEAAG